MISTKLRTLWDSLRKTYWFLPTIMMFLSILLWLGTTALDYTLSAGTKRTIAWLYMSDADDIRNLLLTIVVAIIGVIGVVFSIIMVPLSIAASQFGPRLLRTFLRDLGTQLTLGTFVATFIFCMAVLLQLSGTGKTHPLPQVSVNVALLLGLLSFGMLLFFINHAAVSTQAPVVAAKVYEELHRTILHDFPEAYLEGNETPTQAAELNGIFLTISATENGYIQVRNDDRLLKLATEHNVVIELLCESGDFMTAGIPIARVYPAAVGEKVFTKSVLSAFELGVQRTLVQDVTFGINELVEMAVRAMSPAINDPFTAITCLDWIGSALCLLCNRSFQPENLCDENCNLRIRRHPVTFTALCGAAFHQIRDYSRGSRSVMMRMMEVLTRIAICTRNNEQREAMRYHAELVQSASVAGLSEAEDRKAVIHLFHKLEQVLGK